MKKIVKIAVFAAATVAIAASAFIACEKQTQPAEPTAVATKAGETNYEVLFANLFREFAGKCIDAYEQDSVKFQRICVGDSVIEFLRFTGISQTLVYNLYTVALNIKGNYQYDYQDSVQNENFCSECAQNGLSGLATAITTSHPWFPNLPDSIYYPPYYIDCITDCLDGNGPDADLSAKLNKDGCLMDCIIRKLTSDYNQAYEGIEP